jgi:hypothetical protein
LIDGLDEKKFTWKKTAKHLVYLLTDAPAHGKHYWDKSELATETRVYSDFLPAQPEGTIEALVARYCRE